MLESMSEQMPDRMLERMSEYAIAMPVPVLSDIRIIYFQMICQKLCQNSCQGGGRLK